MIPLSPEAEAQFDDLLDHFERLERPAAIRNLVAALERTAASIERTPDAGLPAPRPYPSLARFGLRWIKSGAYWFAWADAGQGPTIAGVFHEAADIPNRF